MTTSADRIAWLAALSAERRALRARGISARHAIWMQTGVWRVRAFASSAEYRPPDLLPASVRQVRRLAKLQGGLCYLCGQVMRAEPTREHVVPKARGGKNARNVLAAHQACNLLKADRAPYPCELLYRDALYDRLDASVRPA